MIAAKGMSPTQFAKRYAEARGYETADERDLHMRTAKRWLSEKQREKQVRPLTGNRAIVEEILGLPPGGMNPPASPDSDTPRRVAALEAEVFDPNLDDPRLLHARLRSLEVEVALLGGLLSEGFALLGLQVDREADPGSPSVRRAGRAPRAGGAR